MELSKQQKVIDRKFAYNTGKLPGFVDFDPNAQRPLDMPTGEPDFAGVKNSVNRTLNSINPGGEIDTLEGPTNKVSKQLKVGNIQTAVGGLGQLATGLAGSFNAKSKEEILAEYHPVQRTVAGRAYTVLSKAKDGKLPGYSFGNIANSTVGGATAGSVAGPWGAFIGGVGGFLGGVAGTLISGKKEEENRRTVANWVKSYNNGERNNTISQVMGENNQSMYGNQYTQSLIPHANGKLPGFNNGLPNYSFTEHGLVLGLKPNAMGAPGETMSDGNGNDFVLPGKPSNNDTLPIFASGKTTIVTNKKGLSKYYQQTGDLDGVQAAMAYYKKHGYKNGRLPGCAEGWLGNGIPALFGTIAGLGQYLDAKNSTPYRPHSYVANPYEASALNTLAGLRINPYPITRELRDAEARSNRAIDIAGGLSGSQRTAARLAALNTTQGNISKLLSDIQQQNNAYRANYAQAAINAGQQARTARMAANQWDLDYYSKAHAARNKGIQTGIANMLAQIQQYQSNEFKRRQLNDAMDLYRDDMDQRKKHMNWIQNHSGLNISQNADPIKNPSSQYWNQLLPSEKWLALYNRGIIG